MSNERFNELDEIELNADLLMRNFMIKHGIDLPSWLKIDDSVGG